MRPFLRLSSRACWITDWLENVSTILAQYRALLRSRWRWILWGVLIMLGATTVLLVLWPPLYRSEATVFVRTPGDVSQVNDGGDSYAQARAETYAALADSSSISSRVVADLGLDLKPEILSQRIHATHPRGTALIDIAVSAPSPPEAQRTARVLLSEYATTVRTLEAVPGSLIPRAELVVVDPPGRPTRIAARGAPIPVVLLGAALIGVVLGSLGAVLCSIIKPPVQDEDHVATNDERLVSHVNAARIVPGESDATIDPTGRATGATGRTTGRHRRAGRPLTRPNEGDQ
jgi:capsular polysaccharide biosynthesis protein